MGRSTWVHIEPVYELLSMLFSKDPTMIQPIFAFVMNVELGSTLNRSNDYLNIILLIPQRLILVL